MNEINIVPQKINSYLDGTLSLDEKNKFEAMMRLDRSLSNKVRERKEEYDLFCSMIPHERLSPPSLEMIQTEIKNSVFDLVDEKPETLRDWIRIKWESFFNRLQRD